MQTVSRRLEGAGKEVNQVVAAYQEGTSRCVERFEQHLNKEHHTLMRQWDEDGKKFAQRVSSAKKSAKDHHEDREKGIDALERDTAERQDLYDRASESLRSFQRHVLRG